MSDSRDIFSSIRKKLHDAGVKVAGIVDKCEHLDKNKDGVIHVDDLEDVIRACLKDNKPTKREMHHLLSHLSHDRRRGNIEYSQLFDILEPKKKRDAEEKWYDPEDDVKSPDHHAVTKPGSVGEFLQRGACPAEIKNFKRFIAALERFERDSGMKINPVDEGFVVPLGPDLRVSIKFLMP